MLMQGEITCHISLYVSSPTIGAFLILCAYFLLPRTMNAEYCLFTLRTLVLVDTQCFSNCQQCNMSQSIVQLFPKMSVNIAR